MFSILAKTALASLACIAIGVGVAAIGLSSPASAAMRKLHTELSLSELGVTGSYGYGDDYAHRQGPAREADRVFAPASRGQRPDYGEAAAKLLATGGLRDRE
jgi:hypothetical protein